MLPSIGTDCWTGPGLYSIDIVMESPLPKLIGTEIYIAKEVNPDYSLTTMVIIYIVGHTIIPSHPPHFPIIVYQVTSL